MGWASWPLFIFMFLASFLWPSAGQIIGRKLGFRNFLKKNIGSIHFIPGIYPYRVRLLTPIHFRVPSLWWPNIWLKTGIFIGYFWMRSAVIRAGVYCPHLWAQLLPIIFIRALCTHSPHLSNSEGDGNMTTKILLLSMHENLSICVNFHESKNWMPCLHYRGVGGLLGSCIKPYLGLQIISIHDLTMSDVDMLVVLFLFFVVVFSGK